MTYKEGLANLRVGRNKSRVQKEVEEFLKREKLDILYVCEAAPYKRQMRRAAKKLGYRYFTGKGGAEKRNTGIFVRKGLKVEASAVVSLGGQRWERAKRNRWKGLHPARYMTIVRVDGANLASVHKAPGPYNNNWPLRRRAKNVEFRRLTKTTRQWNSKARDWVIAGDWNMGKNRAEVKQFANNSNGNVSSVGGIDYIISKGWLISNMRKYTYTNADHDWRVWVRK